MKFELGKSLNVKDIWDFNKFEKDLGDTLVRSVNKFANEEILPIVLKDTGTLRNSLDVIQTNKTEVVIYFDDNICPYTVEAHELPNWYKWTTPNTSSGFLKIPIETKGKQIFDTVEQVMKVKGWK